MNLHRGDIILVPFPFTDLSAKKVRPALIISSNPQREDVVVAFISSVIADQTSKFDYVLHEAHPDFAISGLKKSSTFKLRKLLTLHQNQILRYLGSITATISLEIDERLSLALGLKKDDAI